MNVQVVSGDLLDQDVDVIVNAPRHHPLVVLAIIQDQLAGLDRDGTVLVVRYQRK
jgi:hypothetical protein